MNYSKKFYLIKYQIKKKKFADFVIDNNGSKVKTRRSLKKILEKIISTGL